MTTKTGTESKNPIIPNKLPPSTSAKITQNELIPKLFPETLGDITFASIIETITTIIINHKTVLKVEVKSNTIAIGIAPR